MANKQLFKSQPGRLPPETNACNEAGGKAYALSPKAALAQYAATGCLNATFYAHAEMQLDTVLGLCAAVEPAFIAKTAVYARRRGQMKDMPALLTAWLAQHGPDFLEPAFAKVIDNGRMLRNFVQILRSGAVGRKSLGSRPKRLVQNWLNSHTDAQLLSASVGNDPSLADVLKMVHPKPATPERTALYAWLIGKPHDPTLLPEAIQALERFRNDVEAPVPDVPFELLTALPLRPQHWVAIACQAPWQMTRMNLNTFARHEVFKVGGMAQRIAERLRDPAAIRRARVFPYQLLSAYTMTDAAVPEKVRDALQDALDVALENVPELPGQSLCAAGCIRVDGFSRHWSPQGRHLQGALRGRGGAGGGGAVGEKSGDGDSAVRHPDSCAPTESPRQRVDSGPDAGGIWRGWNELRIAAGHAESAQGHR